MTLCRMIAGYGVSDASAVGNREVLLRKRVSLRWTESPGTPSIRRYVYGEGAQSREGQPKGHFVHTRTLVLRQRSRPQEVCSCAMSGWLRPPVARSSPSGVLVPTGLAG